MSVQILLHLPLLAGICIVCHAVNDVENEVGPPMKYASTKMPSNEMLLEVDILKLMNVSHKDQGVSIVEGPIKDHPAYKFRLPYGNVPLIKSAVVTQNMNKTNGFTVIFLYRQQKNNAGTLLSVNSPGRLTPWFQLTSNSKTGILTLKYRLKDPNRLQLIEWSLPRHHRKSPLAAWIWLALSFDINEELVRLDLDCAPSVFEKVPVKKGTHLQFGLPGDALVYFRQEPGRKKKFLGSMQVAKILPYVTHERLWNCQRIHSHLHPDIQKPILGTQ